jgi:hypothetical protein
MEALLVGGHVVERSTAVDVIVEGQGQRVHVFAEL